MAKKPKPAPKKPAADKPKASGKTFTASVGFSAPGCKTARFNAGTSYEIGDALSSQQAEGYANNGLGVVG